ncbi:hypothetical protein [Streptomyces sp. Agncl-13]|uniref:hypothetical protein n=1 Tax=Streptomyces sp. Agncl-13 TaxID=3400628 RepID=UPI003A856615
MTQPQKPQPQKPQPPDPAPDPASQPGKAPPRRARARKDPAPKDPASKDPAPKDPAPKDPAPKDPASKDPPLPQELSSPEIVNAITALTSFLRNSSQTRDPQAFSPRQLNIERDFRDLLAGLGRGGSDSPGRLVRPVLSDGLLELGAPLPDEAVSIGCFTRSDRRNREVWRVKVAEATRYPGDPTHLRHEDIVAERVVRLRVFDGSGRRILTGIPKIAPAPSRPPT